MTDRAFTYPNYGDEARVEVHGREVYVVLIAKNVQTAEALAEDIVEQMKAGALNLTMMGKPTRVTEQ
jgi:hypothetical protein